MNSKTKKQLLSLVVSLAMAASVSFTPVYAGDDDVVDVTIEIPTGNAEGSYTYEVSSDGTSTVSETSGSSDESGSEDGTTSETSGDSSDSSDADSDTTEAAAESTDETAETTDGTDTTASETTDTDATEAPAEEETESPAEATDTPEATATPATVSATSTETSAAEDVQALIDALPSVDKLADMDTDELNEVYTAFSEACEAYDALSEDEQAEVDDSKLDELSDYFNGAVMTLAETEEATNPGVTCTMTPDYINKTYVYSWDFSGVTDALSSSTMYSAGNGLEFYLNSGGSINSNYNGIYSSARWLTSESNTAATQYVKFTPTEDGTLYFSLYFAGSSARRAYYSTDGIPTRGSSYTGTTGSSTDAGASTVTTSLSVTADTTLYICTYSDYSTDASAMYDFKFIASNSSDFDLTPISGAFNDDTDTYTWDFVSTGTTSSTTSFDYSDAFADVRIGLGSGDSLIENDNTTSCGIYFSNGSLTGDTYVNATGRYIMVKPTVSGTITFTINFPSAGTASTTKCRIYYAEWANTTFESIDLSKHGKSTSTLTNAGANKAGYSTDITSSSSTEYTLDLTAGYTYVFYTFQKASYITAMTYTPTIVTGKNIDLTSGEIVMNVYVDSDVINTSGTASSTANYTPEIASETTTYTDSDSVEHTVYAVSQKILASEMANEIAITIPLSGGGTYTYTTSVKEYATEALTSATDAQAKAINAMLDYGSVVQALANNLATDSTTLVNGGKYQDGVTDVTATDIKRAGGTKSTKAEGSFAPNLQSMNMNFNYNFNLGLTFDSSIDGCTVAVTVGGETCDNISAAISTDKMSVIVAGLNAEQLSKVLVVTLTSGDGSSTYTITTTGLYYARLLVDGSKTTTSDAQKLLGKALYKYVSAVNSLNTTDTTEEA